MLSCLGATAYFTRSTGSTRRLYSTQVSKDVGAQPPFVVCLQINMPRYSDIQSWIGGLVEIMFFLDFLNYRPVDQFPVCKTVRSGGCYWQRFTGNSILRSFVLKVDTKINEISDQAFLTALGVGTFSHSCPVGGIQSAGFNSSIRSRRD